MKFYNIKINFTISKSKKNKNIIKFKNFHKN